MTDFEKLKEILDEYDINYHSGRYYTDSDEICGYWIEIESDINFNEKGEIK